VIGPVEGVPAGDVRVVAEADPTHTVRAIITARPKALTSLISPPLARLLIFVLTDSRAKIKNIRVFLRLKKLDRRAGPPRAHRSTSATNPISLHKGYRDHFDRLGEPEGIVGVATPDRDNAQRPLATYEGPLDMIVIRAVSGELRT
jgi:hypothetical protein